MDALVPLSFILIIVFVIWTIGRVFSFFGMRKEERIWNSKSKWEELTQARGELQERITETEVAYGDLAKGQEKLTAELEAGYTELAKEREAVRTIAAEKSIGFPWLASAYADYFQLREGKVVDWLDTKKHAAKKAAEKVRVMSQRRRKAEKLWRMFRYQLEYYEALFPWLVDFKEVDSDELIRSVLTDETDEDENVQEIDYQAKKFLVAAEYELPPAEKYQRALDRYRAKRSRNWEVGRDYERYVGYLYETRGYAVCYQGIREGLKDLGRDLIATKGNKVEIIQCKCWSKRKTIHEKHIFQLYGTTIEYWLKQRHESPHLQARFFPELIEKELVQPTFFTSTTVSDVAREFADVLKIQVIENKPLCDYPCIKCNVSRTSGEKIYHLPFDQQYDAIQVEPERDECYVETVAEAEALGFRRAFRWRGKGEKS